MNTVKVMWWPQLDPLNDGEPHLGVGRNSNLPSFSEDHPRWLGTESPWETRILYSSNQLMQRMNVDFTDPEWQQITIRSCLRTDRSMPWNT